MNFHTSDVSVFSYYFIMDSVVEFSPATWEAGPSGKSKGFWEGGQLLLRAWSGKNGCSELELGQRNGSCVSTLERLTREKENVCYGGQCGVYGHFKLVTLL